MKDQCGVVRLSGLNLLVALTLELADILHVQYDLFAVPVALCDCGIVLVGSFDSRAVDLPTWDQDEV